MTRSAIVYSSRAREDMLDIWTWIAQTSGASTADTIIDRIEHRIARLTDFPEMGPMRPDIAETARMMVVERWLVLYALVDETVRIVRIVDGVIDLRRIGWNP